MVFTEDLARPVILAEDRWVVERTAAQNAKPPTACSAQSSSCFSKKSILKTAQPAEKKSADTRVSLCMQIHKRFYMQIDEQRYFFNNLRVETVAERVGASLNGRNNKGLLVFRQA